MAPALLPSSPALAQSSTSRLPQTALQDGGSYDSQPVPNAEFIAAIQFMNRNKELEEKLATLEKEAEVKIGKKQVALDEVLDSRDKEKKAHLRTREKVQSLENEIKEEKKAFDKQTEQIKSLQSDVASFQSKYEVEKHKVANARSENDNLRQQIASRESTITELKSAGSRLKEQYTASKDKIKQLQAENSDLDQRLKAATDRVRELEGFATGFIDVDENLL